jgi:hypothetical protein
MHARNKNRVSDASLSTPGTENVMLMINFQDKNDDAILERVRNRYARAKLGLFLLHGWHPFYLPPFLNQEILHILINLPVGPTRTDAVIAESHRQFQAKK